MRQKNGQAAEPIKSSELQASEIQAQLAPSAWGLDTARGGGCVQLGLVGCWRLGDSAGVLAISIVPPEYKLIPVPVPVPAKVKEPMCNVLD